MILPRRPLKPRTFRIPAGQSVTIGGVARVDVLESPTATLYLTAWISDQVVCHMGKTDGAAERYAKHAGTKLMPPVGGEERFATFPALRGWERRETQKEMKKCECGCNVIRRLLRGVAVGNWAVGPGVRGGGSEDLLVGGKGVRISNRFCVTGTRSNTSGVLTRLIGS